MDATRLISLVILVVASLGLAVVNRSGSWPMTVAGAVLVIASALAFFRLFWRESDRKRKQDLAGYSRTVDAAVARLTEASNRTHEDIADLRLRGDGFFQGILEYVSQLELEVEAAANRIEKFERDAVKHRDEILVQVAGVVGLYSVLRPDIPYPTFGGWAISGDCAQRLVALILSIKPKAVIEVGSGLSTVLIAQALELIGGEGRLVTLEHDKRWLEETSALVAAHGVSHRVTLAYAPLVTVPIGEESFTWYDVTGGQLPERAQLVFVDGPPKDTGTLARYPALPMLFDRLDEGGILLMDDATRPDERAAIERWREEFPGMAMRFHSDTKGTVEIIMSTT